VSEAGLVAEIPQNVVYVADDTVSAILYMPRLVPRDKRIERGCWRKG
jgi:hypothetical protein